MALIDWTDEYSVDNGPIDEQHRQLVEIVNKFDEAQKRGKGTRIMNEILNDLMGYTQEHFAFEENLLAEAGYPALKQHQSKHRQLIQKLEKIQYDFTQNGKRVTKEMGDILKYWLTDHILKDDKAYVDSLSPQETEA
jgi:hemerythrin